MRWLKLLKYGRHLWISAKNSFICKNTSDTFATFKNDRNHNHSWFLSTSNFFSCNFSGIRSHINTNELHARSDFIILSIQSNHLLSPQVVFLMLIPAPQSDQSIRAENLRTVFRDFIFRISLLLATSTKIHLINFPSLCIYW